MLISNRSSGGTSPMRLHEGPGGALWLGANSLYDRLTMNALSARSSDSVIAQSERGFESRHAHTGEWATLPKKRQCCTRRAQQSVTASFGQLVAAHERRNA